MRGILDKVKSSGAGKKIHDTIHNRVKGHVKKHSFFAVLGIKMLYGLAIIGLIYLGQKIPFKKFVFYDIIVNASLCVIIYSVVSFFDAKLSTVWTNIGQFQIQLLLVACALFIIYLIQKFLAKKGINLI